MRTYKLIIAYDGTSYVGWQRQAIGVSIQGLIEDALARLDGHPVSIVGAGRTDAGVHALGQVARAVLTAGHEPAVVQRALNATLPADIRIVRVDDVPPTFHPRFDARSKRYQYWIWESPVLPPALRSWCWHIGRRLDTDAMNIAARVLEGRHDCVAFRSTGDDVHTTVRTIIRAQVWTLDAASAPDRDALAARLMPAEGRFVVFDVEADGFLRHMVRALTGTLVEIGDGRRPAESMRTLLDGVPRSQAGATAPAHGLVMVGVRYGD
ncbi:MAG: tRNA pseudouridine(38-40) synthase TruA [Vicinamibacterales bacterium]|nr:tRNA pseudouridine(38-40) synthase TruA [Vicinamibacterales bacterium]